MGHMPVYEYACTTCGERTEARQTFDDPPLEECPICGGPLRKLYSPVGIVFKGSGFYSTESKRDSRARDGQAAASSNSDKAGKSKEATGSEAGSGSGDRSGAAAGSTTGSSSGSGEGSGSGGPKTSEKAG
jgi:putative FmdB family regulatory protein